MILNQGISSLVLEFGSNLPFTLCNTFRYIITAGHCTYYCSVLNVPVCQSPIPFSELRFKVKSNFFLSAGLKFLSVPQVALGEYDYKHRSAGQEIQRYHATRVSLHPKYKNTMR